MYRAESCEEYSTCLACDVCRNRRAVGAPASRRRLTGRDARDLARVISAVSAPGVRAIRAHGVTVYLTPGVGLTNKAEQGNRALPGENVPQPPADGESLPDARAPSQRALKRAQRSAARAAAFYRRKGQQVQSNSLEPTQHQQQLQQGQEQQQTMEQRDSASVRTGQINQAREREQRAAATAAAPPRAVAVARQPGLNASLEGHGDSSSAATHGEESSPPGDRAIGPAKRSAPAPEPEPAPERELTKCENCLSRWCTGGCNEYVCYDCRRTFYGWIHDEVHHLCRSCADDNDW